MHIASVSVSLINNIKPCSATKVAFIVNNKKYQFFIVIYIGWKNC